MERREGGEWGAESSCRWLGGGEKKRKKEESLSWIERGEGRGGTGRGHKKNKLYPSP